MNQPMTLPAHLQHLALPRVADRAAAGLGVSLPPHISIRGGQFTLIDASGNEQPEGNTIDLCVVDVSDHNCKQYYGEKPWTPDSNDPPICWSSNGIGASREAMEPQNQSCADCQWNVRGSATSKLSGVAIKACRDEKWLAVIPVKYPGMCFQMRVTPGSFKNWQAYVKMFEAQQVDLVHVVTRATFQPGINGVLVFQSVTWIDEAMAAAVTASRAEKKTDVLVGRNDVPIGALPVPDRVIGKDPMLAAPYGQTQQDQGKAQGNAQVPFVPASAPVSAVSGAFQPQASGQAPGFASSAQPQQPEAPRQRRTRRTAAQVAVDTASQPQGAPQQAPFMQPGPPAAPPVQIFTPAANPAPQPNGFGMQPGTPPNAEIQQTIRKLFGNKPAGGFGAQ